MHCASFEAIVRRRGSVILVRNHDGGATNRQTLLKEAANDKVMQPTVATAAPSSDGGAVAAPVGAVAPRIAANLPPQNADVGDLGSGVRKQWSQLSGR